MLHSPPLEGSARPLAALRKCPICESFSAAVELEVTARQAAQHFVLRECQEDRHNRLVERISALWGREDAVICICDGCGFGFADPHVAGDARFYDLAFGASAYPSWKWEFKRTLRALRGRTFESAIEVGAGQGLFLDNLSPKAVPRHRIHALEHNTDARARLLAKGYKSSGGTLDDIEQPVDVIFMFQILEHMDDPHSVFANIARLLKRGGSAFIAVPNPRRVEFEHANGGLIDMPPNHIGRWTEGALRFVTETHGLRVAECETSPFEPLEFLKSDLIHATLRASHQSGSRANDLFRRGRKVQAILEIAVRRVPTWRKANRRLGQSLWARIDHGRIAETPIRFSDRHRHQN